MLIFVFLQGHVSSTSYYSTCQSDGQWSNSGLKCMVSLQALKKMTCIFEGVCHRELSSPLLVLGQLDYHVSSKETGNGICYQ